MIDAEFQGWLKELAGPGGSDLYVTVGRAARMARRYGL